MKNSKWLIILFGAVVIGGAVMVYTTSQKSSRPVDTTQNNVDTSNPDVRPQVEAPVANSRYVIYSDGILETVTTPRRVLFFYASWCPICRPVDASFTEDQGKIPSDLTVIRVNYNDPDTSQEEKQLAAKYGVTYQHTFVQIDENGNEITKWSGGQIEELISNIK